MDLEKVLRLYAPLVMRRVQTRLHMTPKQYAHLAGSARRDSC